MLFYCPTAIDPSFPFRPTFAGLFSSANTQPITPNTSRATTPIGEIEAFDPSQPSVTPADSVLLLIGKVPAYLDEVLKALALHTEARTSFITYAFSLPIILPHKSHPPSTFFSFLVLDSVIGCRIYSSTNTSRCVSYRRRRTSKQRRCASRPRLTSSLAYSCSSAASPQATCAFGNRRLPVRPRRMAIRHFGRGS
jgi:hypothetical protein